MPLFARRGFAGTTTREIARTAGISEALLFQHFPSKAALYAEILQSGCQGDPGLDALSGLEPSTATLVRMTRLLLGHFVLDDEEDAAELGCRRRMVLHSLLDDGEYARLLFGWITERIYPAVRRQPRGGGRRRRPAPGADRPAERLLVRPPRGGDDRLSCASTAVPPFPPSAVTVTSSTTPCASSCAGSASPTPPSPATPPSRRRRAEHGAPHGQPDLSKVPTRPSTSARPSRRRLVVAHGADGRCCWRCSAAACGASTASASRRSPTSSPARCRRRRRFRRPRPSRARCRAGSRASARLPPSTRSTSRPKWRVGSPRSCSSPAPR